MGERHWDDAYATRGASGVSWYQPSPDVSLELIDALALPHDAAVLDVGGGASTLVDRLVERGWADVTVLDISAAALHEARRRLAGAAGVEWLHRDVLQWRPERRYGLWHDRAVFHFLVERAERDRYVETLGLALAPGGAVVVGAFAPDAPERCSGLPVRRYSPDELVSALGGRLDVVERRREVHTTPTGAGQPFTWIAARLA